MADKLTIAIEADTKKAVAEINKLGKAEQEAAAWSKALGAEQDKMLAAIESGAEKAAAEQKKLALATADWAKKTEAHHKNLAKAAEESAKKSDEGLMKMVQGWTDLRGAISSAIGVAQGFVGALVDHERQTRALAILGDSYNAVSIATQGTVTAQEALRTQQGLVQSGLEITGDELGTVARAAREFALRTGGDASQALDQLTDALKGGEAEGLRRFGLSADSTRGRTENFTNALRQLREQQAATAPSARTLGEDVRGLGEDFQRMAGFLATSVSGPLTEVLDWYMRVSGLSTSFRAGVREVTQWFGGGAEERHQGQMADVRRGHTLSMRDDFNTEFRRRFGSTSTIPTAGRSDEDLMALNQRIRRGDSAQSLIGLAQAQDDRRTQTREAASRTQEGLAAERQAQTSAENRAARGTGGGTRPEHRSDFTLNLLAFEHAAQVAREQLQAGAQAATENARLSLEYNQSQKALENERRARDSRERAAVNDRASRLAQRDRGTRAMARRESLGGRVLGASGIETDEDGQVKLFDPLVDGANLLGGAVSSLKTNLVGLFTAIASGSMSAGEAFAAFGLKMLSSIGEQSINQGVQFMFQGVASLASGNPAGAITFAAGAGLVALGTGLGAVAAAAAPGGTPAGGANGAAATGAGRSASGASPKSSSESAAPVTIYLSSLVAPGPGELQGLVRAGRQSKRYGLEEHASVRPVRV